MDNNLPSTGLIPHVPSDTDHRLSGYAAAAPIFDWTKIKIKNSPPPGKDQNGSGSCTAQAGGYAFFNKTKIDISRHDVYANTFLPGGGAYLISPFQWLASHGYLELIKFPEPAPETEQAMETLLQVTDGDRVRKFKVLASISPVTTIDAVAQTIMDHDAAVIGICGSWAKGWEKSWIQPYYAGQNDWQHALWCLNPIIDPDGDHAIDCMSSWYNHKDPASQQTTHHLIDNNYFANGGVFELIAVDIQEILTDMEQLYTINIAGKCGILHVSPDGGWLEFASNEADYSYMGKKYNKNTCTQNTDGSWSFAPFDFQK